jgi:hypothetical protein
MIFKCWEKPTIFLDLYRGASYAYAEMRLNAGCLKMGLWMAMATPEIDGHFTKETDQLPIGSMYAIYGNIYHQYTPNVSIYTIHGSYGYTSTCKIQLKFETLGFGYHVYLYFRT